MTPEERRLAALDRALTIAANIGISCPACIAACAADIDTFLRTGEVKQFEHPDEGDDGQIDFDFDPELPN